MSEVYESLMEGLNEALSFARGEKTGAVVHQVMVPAVDVAAIRASTACRRVRSRAVSASPRARCSTGNMAAAAPPAPPKCCWP